MATSNLQARPGAPLTDLVSVNTNPAARQGRSEVKASITLSAPTTPQYLCGDGKNERTQSYWQYLVRNRKEPSDEYAAALAEIERRNRVVTEISNLSNANTALQQDGRPLKNCIVMVDFTKDSSRARYYPQNDSMHRSSDSSIRYLNNPSDFIGGSHNFVSLKSALRTYSKHVVARVVYVKVENYFDNLAISVLDALAFEFDLDPRIFCKILQVGRRASNSDNYGNIWAMDAEASHFELELTDPRDGLLRHGSRIFGCFLTSQHPTTKAPIQKILIISEVDIKFPRYMRLASVHETDTTTSTKSNEPQNEQWRDVYVNALLQMTAVQIANANKDPRLFVKPISDLLFNEIRNFMTREVVTSNWSRKTEDFEDTDHDDLSVYVNLATSIKTTMRALKHIDLRWASFQPAFGPVQSPLLQTQSNKLAEYLEILHDHQQSIDLRDRRQLQAEQLQEAKRSTSTAVSVGRLTQVAFVFIPLSFVTSFFGMNLREFDDGKALSWWHFLIAAGLCLVLFPFLINYSPGPVTICAIKLLLHSPVTGLYFSVLVMSNNRPIVKWFCDTFIIPWASRNVDVWVWGTTAKALRTQEVDWKSTLYAELPPLNFLSKGPPEYYYWMNGFSRMLAQHIIHSLYPRKAPSTDPNAWYETSKWKGLYPPGIRTRVDSYLWKTMESWRLLRPVYEDTRVPVIEIKYADEDFHNAVVASAAALAKERGNAVPRYRRWLAGFRKDLEPGASSSADKP